MCYFVGNGGNGGHVLFKASKELNSLFHLHKTESGHAGTPGKNSERHGKSAEHR
jgi:GTPase involved in cell partitioning and DNA repair